MQVRLIHDGGASNLLVFGDHSYPGLRKVVDSTTDDTNLSWGLLLAPHHCSKSAMYWSDTSDGEATLRQDILDDLKSHKVEPGYVISSSKPVPSSNQKGDNPPHAKAKSRYQELVESSHFVVTQEEPSEATPEAIVFSATADGFERQSESSTESEENQAKKTVSAAISAPSSPRSPQRYG